MRTLDCAKGLPSIQQRNAQSRQPTLYVYPDISVVCGEPATKLTRRSINLVQSDVLVAEVTSPSTINYDRMKSAITTKAFPRYRSYLVIDQQSAMVELYARADDGWRTAAIHGLGRHRAAAGAGLRFAAGRDL